MSDDAPRPSGLALMKSWYDRARLWIVYGSVLLVIAILYLGSFLGPVRDFMQTGPHTSETVHVAAGHVA